MMPRLGAVDQNDVIVLQDRLDRQTQEVDRRDRVELPRRCARQLVLDVDEIETGGEKVDRIGALNVGHALDERLRQIELLGGRVQGVLEQGRKRQSLLVRGLPALLANEHRRGVRLGIEIHDEDALAKLRGQRFCQGHCCRGLRHAPLRLISDTTRAIGTFLFLNHARTCRVRKTGPAFRSISGVGKSGNRARQFTTACRDTPLIIAISLIPTSSPSSTDIRQPRIGDRGHASCVPCTQHRIR